MKGMPGLCNSILITAICSFISSIAVLLCAIEFGDEGEAMGKLLLSTVFWLGLAAEQLFVYHCTKLRKSAEKNEPKSKVNGLPGVVTFFATVEGMAADILLALSLPTYVVLALCGIGEEVLQNILLFVIVLSFRFHCIANGKNFRYMKRTRKQEKKHEK